MKHLLCATALLGLSITPVLAQDADTVLAEVDGVQITLEDEFGDVGCVHQDLDGCRSLASHIAMVQH